MALNIPNGFIPNLTKNFKQTAAVLSKLNSDGNKFRFNAHAGNADKVGLSTKMKIGNNQDILDMFPDLELAIQIMTTSIISPNVLTSNSLIYETDNIQLPINVKNNLANAIKDYIEKEYKLEDKLIEILRKSLFLEGCYGEAIIPEATLDDIISQYSNNITMESFAQPTSKSIFFNGTENFIKVKCSLEEQTFLTNLTNRNIGELSNITEKDLGIEITDNLNYLRYKDFALKQSKRKIKQKIKRNLYSFEDDTNIDKTKKDIKQDTTSKSFLNTTKDETQKKMILDKLFRNPSFYKTKDYLEIPLASLASRTSIGKPLTIHFPPESIVPIHVANDPTKHLGYFIVLDGKGHPVDLTPKESEQDIAYYTTNTMDNSSRVNRNNMVTMARNNLLGYNEEPTKLQNNREIYYDILTNLIKNKINSGNYDEIAVLSEDTNLYEVMFERSLKSMKTKLVYIPEEMFQYYAFSYRKNGTGESLMEKVAVYASLRAILLFSNVMAQLKNSTPIVEVTTSIPENDPNPMATREKVVSEALRTAQTMLPLGAMRPRDLVDWVQKRGMRFKFVGPSGGPDLNIDVQDIQTQVGQMDPQIDDYLSQFIYMTFGLTPEIVQSGYSSDYATTVVAKNLLFAKRVIRYQELFCSQITNHVRKLISFDEKLKDDLRNIVTENMKDIKSYFSKTNLSKEINDRDIIDYIIENVCDEIKVNLPKPETYDANNVKVAFEDYRTSLDEISDVIFNDATLNDACFGNLSTFITPIKEMWKTSFLIKWLTDNNYMPEVTDTMTKNEEGNYILNPLNTITNFMDSITDNLIPFLKNRLPQKDKVNKELDQVLAGTGTTLEEIQYDSDVINGYQPDQQQQQDNNQEVADEDQQDAQTQQQQSNAQENVQNTQDYNDEDEGQGDNQQG